MFLVLATLILRPVGFEFRNKIEDPRWRTFWDYALFAGGLVPSLVFGVAFGNVLQGVPFRIDSDLRVLYEGSGLFELLNPFGLLCGLVSLGMLTTHGAVYLTLKADGAVKERAAAYVRIGALATVVLFVLAGLWIAFGIKGYAITGGTIDRRPIESAAEDGHARCAGNGSPTTRLQVDDAGAGARHRRAAADPRRSRPAGGPGLAFVASAHRHFRHHFDGRGEHVPVPDAVRHHAAGEPDGVGRDLEPADAVRDAAGDAGLPADRARLYRLRLPRLRGPVTAKQIEGNSAHLY